MAHIYNIRKPHVLIDGTTGKVKTVRFSDEGMCPDCNVQVLKELDILIPEGDQKLLSDYTKVELEGLISAEQVSQLRADVDTAIDVAKAQDYWIFDYDTTKL